MLNTTDYGCWDVAVAGTLGHHSSRLLSSARDFRARFRCGWIDELQIIHIKGSGQLEMVREQCDQAVLWMPLQGITEEAVNGRVWVAEPGAALLLRPGDHLHGRTSLQLEGVSIRIPLHGLPPLPQAATPLIEAGPIHQQLLATARQLVAAAAQAPPGVRRAVDPFLDSLANWALSHDPTLQRERITAVRRRALVAQAHEWMEPRLAERFGVVELSQALQVSVRSLQYSFQAELGCTPMAAAKRLRLRRLRQLLQDRALSGSSIADLMAAAGLLACGGTAADYRRCYGESPRQTRQQGTA